MLGFSRNVHIFEQTFCKGIRKVKNNYFFFLIYFASPTFCQYILSKFCHACIYEFSIFFKISNLLQLPPTKWLFFLNQDISNPETWSEYVKKIKTKSQKKPALKLLL